MGLVRCLVCVLVGSIIISAGMPRTVEAQQVQRPKIGLVLGGGGARGAAHVGVLKVLEELQIPIDYVAGNSMGAIIGGLYASGLSPHEIEREIAGIDWDGVMDDNPSRPDRAFRRKRDDDNYLVKKYTGISADGVKLPLGFIQGQKFDMELVRLMPNIAGISDFDKLPIPFRAVATDLETGQAVVLRSGNLARSIRASMAVPGAFDPVEIDGKLLVDGLVSNNVPVNLARDMGADILIVVDVGTPLMKRDDVKSYIDILDQMSNVLSYRNVQEQLRTMGPQDVYIQVHLGDITTSEFKRAAEAIALGEKAANGMRGALLKAAFAGGGPVAELARTPAARAAKAPKPVLISFIRVSNQTKLGDDVVANPFLPLVGSELTPEAIKRSIEELYGWNIFESVRYEIVEEGGQFGLLVHVKEKSWGPDYVQLGVALSTDMEGDSTWNLGASILMTALNERAGEARFAVQIGDSPLAVGEFYQPLDVGLRYFVNPKLFFDAQDIGRFVGSRQTEELRVTRYGGEFSAGRVLERWGEVRLGLRRYAGTAEVNVGNPATPDTDFDNAEGFLRLSYDTLDNRNFPRFGALAQWEGLKSIESLGADDDFTQSKLNASGAYSWGENTLLVGARFNYTADGIAPVQNRFSSGGFFNMSGFTQGEISGQQELLLRGGFYRRIATGLFPVYAGMSLEYGNVFEERGDIGLSPDDALLGGSVFLGVDTVLGPVYTSFGHAEGGRNGVYLFLGRLF